MPFAVVQTTSAKGPFIAAEKKMDEISGESSSEHTVDIAHRHNHRIVESTGHIQRDNSGASSVGLIIRDDVGKSNYLVRSQELNPETKLFVGKYVILVTSSVDSFQDHFLKNCV